MMRLHHSPGSAARLDPMSFLAAHPSLPDPDQNTKDLLCELLRRGSLELAEASSP